MADQPQGKIIPDYVKFVEVTYSAMDVTLLLSKASFDVTVGAPITDGGKLPVGAITLNLVMAKALAKDLTAAIEACERQFGPIAAPPANANVVPLRPVEGAARGCAVCGSPYHETEGCPDDPKTRLGARCPDCGVAVGEFHWPHCSRHLIEVDKSDPLGPPRSNQHK